MDDEMTTKELAAQLQRWIHETKTGKRYRGIMQQTVDRLQSLTKSNESLELENKKQADQLLLIDVCALPDKDREYEEMKANLTAKVKELEEECQNGKATYNVLNGYADIYKNKVEDLQSRLTACESELNQPETIDFIKGVRLEAAHQRKRWEHDKEKTDADWYWTLGYLASKTLHKESDDPQKFNHWIITCAAMCANWHYYKNTLKPDQERKSDK